MPMTREEHEAFLNELLGGELEHSRKTEILQELRGDYSNVLTDFEEMTTNNQKLAKDNDDLVKSNSMLFRQSGIVGNQKEEEKEKEKEFSETVTLESIAPTE